MKVACFVSFVSSVAAFQIAGPVVRRAPRLFSAMNEEPSVDVAATLAKSELLEIAEKLNDRYGCLLIDSAAQDTLREAVEKLETVAVAPDDTTGLLGDWTLLCSTGSASLEGGPFDGASNKIGGIDTSKLPFFNDGPLQQIRDTINKSLRVKQVIQSKESDGVDRIDHVLQYMPPDTLSAFLNDLPDAIKTLNINPLQVSQSKVTLIHKAEIESVVPVIKTKLSLQSVTVNVAGKSQILDPQGADVLGINLPFGEFLNAGSFDTTYMDDNVRISRSRTGIVDQLRVFVRADAMVDKDDAMARDKKLYLTEEADDSAPSDVDDSGISS